MNKNRLVFLLGLAGFIVMADNWVVSPILPAIAADLRIDIADAGMLITAYMLPFGIFQLIFGPLADRFGKKQMIAVGMVLFAAASGLCSLGSALTDLAIFRALTGVFAASVIPISLALIADVFPIQERQTAIGTFMGISFLGQGLSFVIGGTIAYLFNWRGVFGVYALFACIPIVFLAVNFKAMPTERSAGGGLFAPYARLLGSSRSLLTYIVILLEGIFILGSFSYAGATIARTFGFNNFLIGLTLTGFGVMTVLGGRVAGRLAARMGTRNLLSLGLLAAALGDLSIYLSGQVLALTILGIALLGLGFVLAHSTLLTRATEFAREARGAAMSLVAFSFMSGGGVGTALGGRIIAAFGIEPLFLIFGLGLAGTLALSYVLIRDMRVEKGAKLPASESAPE